MVKPNERTMELVRNILTWGSLAAALGMATVCAVVWCGGTNLVQYTGEPLPYTRTLAPNETVHFVNRYTAVKESAAGNDIVVTATFVGNGTGWRKVSEAKATAVRVEIEPIF